MRLRAAMQNDLPARAEIAVAAFARDEAFVPLYPPHDQFPDDLRRWWLLRIKQRLNETGTRIFVAVFVAEEESCDDKALREVGIAMLLESEGQEGRWLSCDEHGDSRLG